MSIRFKVREGDLIETLDGLIFDVKGLLHPPDRAVAYLRYLPDRRGSRKRAGITYRKVYPLQARTALLARRWPEYLYKDPVFHRQIQCVPFDKMKQHYVPTEGLEELRRRTQRDQVEQLAVDMAEVLVTETGTPASEVGVSGSILVDLHTSHSDIDLILYGTDAARRCHPKLRALLETHALGWSPHEMDDLRTLYRQRELAAAISFDAFVKHERQKVLQGKFRGTHYFIRCVKDWNELQEAYGDKQYHPVGRVTVRANIGDDNDSIFTPCTYQISDVEAIGDDVNLVPSRIVSFRGRFCEQAHTGERVLVEGLLERVVDERGDQYRLVIGENSRDRLVVVGKHE